MWESEGEFMQSCWETRGEFMGIRMNYLGNLRLFMGNSWGMRGDFSLGIRSSEEVQLQAAQIDTHAKSLTKPRFPFYVRTGFSGILFPSFFRCFFGVVFGGFWEAPGSHFGRPF